MTCTVLALPEAPRRLAFRSVSRTHAGKVRDHNEDAVLDDAAAGLWAVCDGMGGHRHGEVASALAVQALRAAATGGMGGQTGYAYLSDVQERLQGVNRDLIQRAATEGQGPIGATIAVLLAFEEHYACVWAGDSRIYRLAPGEGLRQLTHDHSLAQEQIDAGETVTRGRNLVTRALGIQAPVALEVVDGGIAPDDLFLVCSDGLTGPLADSEIEAILRRADSVESAADTLLAEALTRGAPDNVSLVIVEARAAG